ncbi:thiol:disulfide interchange protein DsbA precursor [Buchnera aphidicola str. Ak (Acyrthosiphon kondoi)]|uniref:Thiol:disulfide interchange protein n=1 Tax=Buchnera aphidicola str. Ak (Acyrthosiphon kondoi) TaxID=1005090 RepID=G2LND0_9GAMM|nr:DsbA family protein [Buchnera aphidicola]AEO08768.1 thiol:disulfide interchange protein DsbA precursor [Buchnera aphidicola str. Ak (Acyrthosiphon kondoi)]
MKKILIMLCIFVLSCNAYSCEFRNGKEYTTKHKTISNIPNIIEFFSFFCPYCYEFEKTHNTRYLIKNNIKKNIKTETYHVDFFGGKLSSILTKSWIIAQKIGIEKKIVLPIFKGIQETHTINNIHNIKKIFKKEGGISENKFNDFWNSLTLKILVKKQKKEIKKFNLENVPTMLINGKYVIDYSKIEEIFKDDFSQKYIKLIQFLINKK